MSWDLILFSGSSSSRCWWWWWWSWWQKKNIRIEHNKCWTNNRYLYISIVCAENKNKRIHRFVHFFCFVFHSFFHLEHCHFLFFSFHSSINFSLLSLSLFIYLLCLVNWQFTFHSRFCWIYFVFIFHFSQVHNIFLLFWCCGCQQRKTEKLSLIVRIVLKKKNENSTE